MTSLKLISILTSHKENFNFISSLQKPKTLALSFLTLVLILTNLGSIRAANQFDINGPAGSDRFGADVAVLPNGNVVVTDPGFDITSPGNVTDAGAVFLYDGQTGALISKLTGSTAGDNIGSGGITVLANGNFVVSSPEFDLPTSSGDEGAVTLVNGTTGLNGTVSQTNSLTGENTNDRVGITITALSNGGFIVQSPQWNNTRGAVTWHNGTGTTAGAVSAANSLVGSSPNDFIGNIKILANGNFVVNSSRWNDGRGSVTLCSQTSGCTGPVSASNSLIGNPGDNVGFGGITELANGNFVVVSYMWNDDRGAVTLVNGTTGLTEIVSASNSLVGSTSRDFVGRFGVTPLTNGNYVVNSSVWKNTATSEYGAATFGNGTTGVAGEISSANSLVGSDSSSFFLSNIVALANGNYVLDLPRTSVAGTTLSGAAIWGSGATGITGKITTENSLYGAGGGGVVPLTNGNYVVISPNANINNVSSAGAVTFGNGTTGITGKVSASNSLVGSSPGDSVGFSGGIGSVTALTNGNYVVSSSNWDSETTQSVGAVTLCDGETGLIGEVSPANSLVGSRPQDQVGFGGSIALANGNYVVSSYFWDNGAISNAGAVTFGNGTTGITGEVSPSNSLVGSHTDDFVGNRKLFALPNGNYVAISFSWNGRGAVTWGNGTTGTTGVVSESNSVVGSSVDDRVGTMGNNPAITVYSDSNYVFQSANWDNGSIADAGAVTLGKRNAPVAGQITGENSVAGTVLGAGTNLVYDYSPVSQTLVVGRSNNRAVTIFRYPESADSSAPFDFDGDGKTDVSIFRPAPGEWWYLRSSDLDTRAFRFGQTTDQIVPADFTGDGKTDIAFFRESTGQWFVLRSEDNSFYAFPFGTSGDVPVPADFDGDGLADPAVFRPSTATWFVSNSGGATTIRQFGATGDTPIARDYDGDGRDDIAIYRPSVSEWFIQRSSDNQVLGFSFGTDGDKAVPSDYTGDGRADIAFWRPNSGEWFVLRSEDNSFFAFPFGTDGDLPVPGDYDGDGQSDAAVFRSSDNTWFIQQSTDGFEAIGFGVNGDKPVPSAFIR